MYTRNGEFIIHLISARFWCVEARSGHGSGIARFCVFLSDPDLGSNSVSV